MNLISDHKFKTWRDKRDITEDVLFGTSNSYFGKCMRSRPGAFFVTAIEITHWSYDPKDSSMAAFEKELKVTTKISEIENIHIEPLNFLWRLAFLGAKWVININTKTGTHKVIVYQNPQAFCDSVKSLGINCV